MNKLITDEMLLNRAEYVRLNYKHLKHSDTGDIDDAITYYNNSGYPSVDNKYYIRQAQDNKHANVSLNELYTTIEYCQSTIDNLLEYSSPIILRTDWLRRSYEFYENEKCFIIRDNYHDIVVYSDEETNKKLKKLYALELLTTE